jgi:hypothetical protein
MLLAAAGALDPTVSAWSLDEGLHEPAQPRSADAFQDPAASIRFRGPPLGLGFRDVGLVTRPRPMSLCMQLAL